jgi:hypothetical protein
MKTTISMQRAGEPACATASRLHPGVASWALIGFGVGVGSATAYLLLGAEYLWDIPLWASVVFFPGFLVGFKVNAWGLDKDVSEVVGVLAVGLAYAALAILARFAWLALKHRRRSTALRQISG